ncbi:hypothetical protein [Erwinia sp. JH02]|nr:hypothetical protein [Erwinia sp. JH02]NNS06009.1 hypothetical protein [Erwinia sp. JH02]
MGESLALIRAAALLLILIILMGLAFWMPQLFEVTKAERYELRDYD